MKTSRASRQSTNRGSLALGVALGALALVPSLSHARELSVAQRVQAQEAIERVYYSHQAGATLPFEEAVPREVLEQKVRTYLEQSAALEELWNTPVTAEALDRELERMARQTRMPERLGELYSALGHDTFLIQECLVRPVLVDRLARNFFAYDKSIHGAERHEAEALRARLASGRLDPNSKHPGRIVMDLVRQESASAAGDLPRPVPRRDGRPPRMNLSPDEFEHWATQLPERVGQIGALAEDAETFVTRVVLVRKPDELRIASFAVKKKSWDDWWRQIEGEFGQTGVVAVASGQAVLPDLAPTSTCLPDDTWDSGALFAPAARLSHKAVWTGSHMIVWGGAGSPSPVGISTAVNTGGRYDPATDTWTPTSTIGAPTARAGHTAVWTGSRMIVWGGGSSPVNTGGRYDPATDTWTATSTIGAPTARKDHTAVWTGNRMIVWGGSSPVVNTGGRYDPATDTWTPTSTIGAPTARKNHTAVWTGSRMIVWGGFGSSHVNTGGRYDPAADTWTPTSTIGAPSARQNHTAVWTGSRTIVWGGFGSASTFNTGGRYDPATDSWTATSTIGAPSARYEHTAVWTGNRMLVWGGWAGFQVAFNTGGRYDPGSDSWGPIPTTGAPSRRLGHTAVWTGSLMLVWGGSAPYGNPLGTGGRYDPTTSSWTSIYTNYAASAPAPHYGHTAVWTGNLMLIWGGFESGFESNTGARYDPITDSWTAMSTASAPSIRESHSAVWTGSRMIVWGGVDEFMCECDLNNGGRYDPLTDSWQPTSTIGAPSARAYHTAVWTGNRMIIWGGGYDIPDLNTGGRYDPATNTWTPTSTVGAPSGRSEHTAVWTGSRMIVWGGSVDTTGGRYDPTTDSWTATSTTGAPSARSSHTAVWTGSRMIVWGGGSQSGSTNTGGRYDPTTDGWTTTSTSGAPSARSGHTAVWTGSQMIVWGGGLDTGGRYAMLTDSWAPTSTIDAPAARAEHTAVWTGNFMLVWGGVFQIPFGFNDGGRYALGQAQDDDGDGFSDCLGDCNDGNSATYPNAVEVNDGQDNQCPGDLGQGLTDEVSGPTGFTDRQDPAAFCWLAQPGATSYQVARSEDPAFQTGCALTVTSIACWSDPTVPPSGSAFYYIVRALTPLVGSWGHSLGEGLCP